jgi:hypothetical protein
MTNSLRLQTTVLPGHRIEISAPELPDGGNVEVIILLDGAPALEAASGGRYPAVLEAEYNRLIEKKLDRSLTPDEAVRLDAVRDEITSIDCGHADVRLLQADKLSPELDQMRTKLEALPHRRIPAQ